MSQEYHGTYDPSKVVITIGAANITGFSDGDFVTAKFDDVRFFKIAGVDGEVSRAKNNSQSGTISLVISSASAANEELTSIFEIDGLGTSVTPVAITIADLGGGAKCMASKCWISKPPELKFGKQIGDNEWVFDCADLTFSFAGARKSFSIDDIFSLF